MKVFLFFKEKKEKKTDYSFKPKPKKRKKKNGKKVPTKKKKKEKRVRCCVCFQFHITACVFLYVSDCIGVCIWARYRDPIDSQKKKHTHSTAHVVLHDKVDLYEGV